MFPLVKAAQIRRCTKISPAYLRYRGAVFEEARRASEKTIFGGIDSSAYGIPQIETPELPDCVGCEVTQPQAKAAMAFDAQDNTEASKLNGSSLRIGATLTLKVMAGDKIDLGVNAWYPEKENGDDDKATPQDVAASLLKILSGSTASASGGHITAEAAGAITSPLLSGIMDFLSSHPQNLGNPRDPAAYINWVLFDESLNYVPAGSGFIKVGTFSDDMQTLAQEGIVVPQSGYLFIYLSNETEHYDVFFDNIMANHTPSAILEETHYYPFGLVQTGISSRAAGITPNKFKFNGKELNNQEFTDGSGLELYDYGARMQDPQLGVWHTIDPLADQMRRFSPYTYCFDNPMRFTDPDGMRPDSTIYLTSSGKELGRTTDSRPNVVTFIPDDNVGAFLVTQSILEGVGADMNSNAATDVMRSFGENYDTKGAFDFVDNNAKNTYTGDVFKPTDGKGPLINEQSAAVEKTNGTWTVNPNKTDQTPGSPFSVILQGNGPVTLHTHDNEGRKYFGPEGGIYTNCIVEKGPASVGADGDVRAARNNGGTGLLQMAAGKKSVYFYNHSGVVATINRDAFNPKYFKR